MTILATAFDCLKLLLVLGVCYVAGTGLFARRNERNSIGFGVVSFTGGFCLLSFFFLLSKVIGSPIVFFAGLPAFIVALHLIRKPELRIKPTRNLGVSLSALALCALASLPVIIMGVRMGSGDYPAEFFSADSPFFLQQAYALMRTTAYPPPSLETYGFSFKYHYGFQAFIALASILTNLQPHFVMFGVIEPLLVLLIGIVVYDISQRLSGRHGSALLCLILVLLGSKQYLFNYLDPSWWSFVTQQENFDFRYPNAPDVAGLLIALCAVRCAIEFEQKNMRLAALFFTCMLPLFKIPYLVPVSAGMALIYCYELRKQFSARLLVEITGAALLSTLCYWVFSKGLATASGTSGFQIAGFIAMSMPWDNQTLLVLCTLLVITAAVTRYRLSDDMLRFFIFACAPYLVFFLWAIRIENGYQIFSLATRLAVLFTAIYLVSAWLNSERKIAGRRFILASIIFCLTGPGAISLGNHIYTVAVHPEQGHEYADNRAVADALLHIPVENTLVATNDTRYPANDYAREFRQFQLAGIFGHQNLSADLYYGGFRREDLMRYGEVLALFQMTPWPAAQISRLRTKAAITHVLIHKHFVHADQIPLALVYENENYAVYRF